jgi:CHAT domain-containing protein/tetratricopeptide (TPR) repeat protein
MMPPRNLRWVLLSLVILAGLAILLWVHAPTRPATVPQSSAKEAKKAVTPEPEIVGEVLPLEPGKPIEAELSAMKGHAYELVLQAGQYAYVIAEQKGIDVAVRLIGPDGHRIVRVDSPNGRQGPEPVREVAEAATTYRIEVVCSDPTAAKGRYEIRIEELRPATDGDRKQVFAERRFAEGERLRRQELAGAEVRRQAIANYEEALPVWRELGDEEREAATLFRIGWMDGELGEPGPALTALQQSLLLYKQLGDRTWEVTVLNFIAPAQLQRGEIQPSLEVAGKALALARDLDAAYLEAAALNNIGNAHLADGDARQALEAFQGALTAARKGPDASTEAVALLGIGDVQVDQRKLEPALDSLEEALEIFKSLGASREEALTLKRVADAQQLLGHLPEASARLNQALEIARRLSNFQIEAVVLNSLGTVRLEQKEVEPAGEAYHEALALSRERHDAPNEAFALLNLGRYFHARKEPRQALDYHEQAAVRFRSLGNLPGEVATSFGSARAQHDLGHYKEADERLKWVLANIELLRTTSASDELRTTYFASKQHYFDLHIDVLMHLAEQEPTGDHAAQAMEMNERRRARGLLDLLLESKAGVRQGAEPALLAEERSLDQAIKAINNSLLGRAAARQGIQGASTSPERQQRSLLDRLDLVRSEMAHRSPRYAELTQPHPLELKEIQKRVLDRDSLMLVYSLGDERSFLWTIGRAGKVTSHVLPARSWIEHVAGMTLKTWRQRSRGKADLRDNWAAQLSAILIQPVASELGTKRLLIVADGALQYIPFAALPDPRSPAGGDALPLVRNHEIVILPSASVLATLRRELSDRDLADQRIAVIADPVFGLDDSRFGGTSGGAVSERGGLAGDLERVAQDVGLSHLERLPFTEQEAHTILNLVPEGMRFEALGFKANRATVTSGELRKYRVLHFATHAFLDPKQPELSGLVLSLVDSKGEPEDGYLRSYEICNLDLNAELVVLSACQTGLGAEIRGEGLVGLTRSFMYAGVPRIVVSLWNVSDRSTAELMRRFYTGMFKKNLAPAAALRCAQLSMLASQAFADPYHWAGFVFQGEWNLDTPPDGGIENPPGGGQPPARSANDLPPPIFKGPTGCPDLL